MPTEEPAADAWCYTVSNSPFPGGIQPPSSTLLTLAQRREKLRTELRKAIDALVRALGRADAETVFVSDGIYVDEQCWKAQGYVCEAQKIVNLAIGRIPKDQLVAETDDGPPTPLLLPNVPVEDGEKGGAA